MRPGHRPHARGTAKRSSASYLCPGSTPARSAVPAVLSRTPFTLKTIYQTKECEEDVDEPSAAAVVPPASYFRATGCLRRPFTGGGSAGRGYSGDDGRRKMSDSASFGHIAPSPVGGPPAIPPGTSAIYQACRSLYPDQPNPLQVTALVKYWLGGPDPLDYISMYSNHGDASRGIPPHWHYVSLGLSDLHGDGRVHENSGGPSGFGFELTFRLRREYGETAPPTWPAGLMQSLAKYVFQSENTFQSGDHVSWHIPLDGSESRIQHMLMTEDAQLAPLTTPFGHLNFIQIVGVCSEELKAAQHWNGPGVLELLRSMPLAGGPWLVTDMRRGETIFELDPKLQERLDQGIEQDGSNLSGVSGFVSWEDGVKVLLESQHGGDAATAADDDKENRCSAGGAAVDKRASPTDTDKPRISEIDSEKIKSMLKKGLNRSSHSPHHDQVDKCIQDSPDSPAGSGGAGRSSSRKHSLDGAGATSDHPVELGRTTTLEAVQLKFNAETGSLLPLALRGRLKHGRHFTFKSALNDAAVTFVPPSVAGAFATEEHPYAAHGAWLQIFLTHEVIERLSRQLHCLHDMEQVDLPKLFSWPGEKLSIVVYPADVTS